MTLVQKLRLAHGLTQKQLAQEAASSLAFIQKLERGLIVPKLSEIAKVAFFFGTAPEALLDSLQQRGPDQIGEGYKTAIQGSSFVLPRRKPITPGRLPMVDLFCGLGGFSYGFERTGEFQVTAGVDLLRDRVETFAANHEHAIAVCSDIAQITPDAFLANSPNPFLLIGGPPCQGFSSIRPFRTLTINDQRNNLFEQFALYTDALRPEWFVMENVVGVLTHKQGATLKSILDLLAGIGYSVSWRVLNGAHYGLPQSRERLFIVGNRRKIGFIWPAPTHQYEYQGMTGKKGQVVEQPDLFNPQPPLPRAVSVMQAIHDLPVIAAGGRAGHYDETVTPTPYERRMRENEQVLTLHEATVHSEKMMEIVRSSGKNISAVAHLVSSGFSTSYSRLDPDTPSNTITVNFVHPSSNRCIHPCQDRALTPREGARIQGFPDSFVFKGKRTQIIKQIGNAVPPLLGEVLANAILANIA